MSSPADAHRKTTILLVDDEALYIEIYQRLLHNRNLEFDIARSGAEALELAGTK